jgi:membrane protease YdiL (CAAX protease family)
VRPRLEERVGPVAAVALASLFLALQHLALPLRFDLRFIAWRALMFLPFALLLGWVLRRRPSFMPYLMAVHGLMDLSAAWAVLQVAR